MTAPLSRFHPPGARHVDKRLRQDYPRGAPTRAAPRKTAKRHPSVHVRRPCKVQHPYDRRQTKTRKEQKTGCVNPSPVVPMAASSNRSSTRPIGRLSAHSGAPSPHLRLSSKSFFWSFAESFPQYLSASSAEFPAESFAECSYEACLRNSGRQNAPQLKPKSLQACAGLALFRKHGDGDAHGERGETSSKATTHADRL